jgi:hypothetical protein
VAFVSPASVLDFLNSSCDPCITTSTARDTAYDDLDDASAVKENGLLP